MILHNSYSRVLLFTSHSVKCEFLSLCHTSGSAEGKRQERKRTVVRMTMTVTVMVTVIVLMVIAAMQWW